MLAAGRCLLYLCYSLLSVIQLILLSFHFISRIIKQTRLEDVMGWFELVLEFVLEFLFEMISDSEYRWLKMLIIILLVFVILGIGFYLMFG